MFQQRLPPCMPPVDVCPTQSVHPCPQLPVGADACLDTHPPAVPTSPDACAPPCCIGTARPAAAACDPNQDQQGSSFPMQHASSPAEPCTLEVAGTCVDTFPMQHASSPVEPCTLEVVGTCVDTLPLHPASPMQPICPQGVIAHETCPDRCFIAHVEPCAPPGTSCIEPGAPQSAVAPGDSSCPQQAPSRPPSRTAAIVERCLARCEKWLRGKK